jgi:hypothetical protein
MRIIREASHTSTLAAAAKLATCAEENRQHPQVNRSQASDGANLEGISKRDMRRQSLPN